MRLFFLLLLLASAASGKAGTDQELKKQAGTLNDSACLFLLAEDTVIGEIYGGVKKKKAVAALLAFPLLGVTGIHRVYLGTQPYVPVVYMGTLGGFLVLPTIDFIVILAADEKTFLEFQNNPRVFMWVK